MKFTRVLQENNLILDVEPEILYSFPFYPKTSWLAGDTC